MQNKNFLIYVAFACLGALGASAWADFKPYTPEELAEWEAMCAKNPKCITAWNGLKKKESERNTALDKVCAKDKKECQEQIEARAGEMLREFAKCEDPSTCLRHVNKNADAGEKLLVDGAWCKANARVCEYVKSRREKRLVRKIAWCDDYSDLCEQALKARVQVLNEHEQHLADIRNEERKRRNDEIKNRVREAVFQEERYLAVCHDPSAECERQINQRMLQAEKLREEQWCQRREDLCNVAKELRTERESRGTGWCDEHPDLCAQAQGR